MAGKRYEIAFELAGRIGNSFGSAFRSADTHMSKLSQNISKTKMDVRELDREYKAGKMSAEAYGAAHERLTNQLTRAERAQRSMSRSIELHQNVTQFRNNMRAQMMDNVARIAMTAVPVKLAMDFESSMADVKKVVDFDTPQQFKQMGDDIIRLSKNIPMAANGLAQIVAAGGQSGIAREELTKFAEDAAKMGVAFDVTADEAGQMMAEWRAAFRMNQSEVKELADKINYLGNTTAASAPRISDVVRRVGPLGEVAGVASGEIAALGASMVGVGVREEIAATGIQNFMLAMVAGESATKKQKEAFSKLGFSAKEMASRMQTDAKGAILDVLSAIRTLDEDTQAATLQEIFGKESIKAIAPLLTSLENLEENFDKVAESSRYAGSMQAEFEARSATTANKVQLFKNQLSALGIEVGGMLLPHLNELLGKTITVTESFSAWASENPKLTKAIVVGTAAVLGLTVAATTLGFAASLVVSPFTSIATLIAKLRTYPALARSSATETQRWAMAQNSLARGMGFGGPGVGIPVDVGGKGKKGANGKGKASLLTRMRGGGAGATVGGRIASRIPLMGAALGVLDIVNAEAGEDRSRAIGGTAGTLIGGALGALLGPLGAIVGSMAGNWIGGKIGKEVYKLHQTVKEAIPTIELFGDEVSSSTKQAVGSFIDLNKEATIALNELSWSGQEVTVELTEAITSNFSSMKEKIVSELATQKEESLTVLRDMLVKSTDISEEEQQKMIETIQSGYEEKIQITTDGEARIQEIMMNASNEKRSITEEEHAEIIRIQQEMLEAGIQLLSETEAEQLAIMERLKAQSTEISATEAAETVRSALERKEKTIAAANQEYEEVLKAAAMLRAEGTAEAEEMADKIIAEAERQKNELISKAEEIHQMVVSEAQAQAKEHVDSVDWETGEVLTKWEKFQIGLKRIWNDINESRPVKAFMEPSMPNASIMGGIPKYARGALITSPHIGMVGEAGPEMIIPMNRSSRARQLWTQAGSILGMGQSPSTDTLGVPKGFGSSSQKINITYAPTIQGNNTQEIREVLEEDKRSFQDKINDILHQNKRVAFTS